MSDNKMNQNSINKRFDRSEIVTKPLKLRRSISDLDQILRQAGEASPISSEDDEKICQIADSIKEAKKHSAPIILIYGAHLFRNGLSPAIIKMMSAGYIQHLATNGAGSIHDWECAFHGKTTEDVAYYLDRGQFGIWEETGFFINLAVILGASEGLGYGESVGKMIEEESLILPSKKELRKALREDLEGPSLSENFNSIATMLETMERENLSEGRIVVPHPHKQYSLQSNAFKLNIPFSICPGIGYDIIYTHRMNSGSAIGQAAVRDFLSLTQTISEIQNGVLIVVGSSVMAPMVVEKAISMARNVAIRKKMPLDQFQIIVNDIQPGTWNWKEGEPPKEHPAYYLRFCKSFSRMGGEFNYIELDNRAFISRLSHHLSVI
jgi:deoxyhypusine synthase